MVCHIDGNSFYASCERVFRPDLYHSPIAVLSNNDGIVIALNAECKALGFRRGDVFYQIKNKIERSGGKVKFSVKAFQDMTHALDKSRCQQLVFEFKKALDPLLFNNLLLCVLFQFPESFHYDKQERIYLDNLIKEMSDIPIVVEMRNTKWQNDNVYNALRERKAGWCITDNPDLKNLPKLDFICTSDIAYIRFHGRNAAMWYTGDNVTRYDYMYSDTELQAFVNPILELLKNTKIVQLFFNNHAKAQATVNAKKLELLVSGQNLCQALI
jgi:uncharacterized protein YecE (DUF72 family)